MLETKIIVAIGILTALVIWKIVARLLLKSPYLSWRLKAKSERKFYKLLKIFENEHRRKPPRDEKFMLVVKSSHEAFEKRGHVGHWKRQKIRKYLTEKHNIAKNYKMR